MNQTANQVDRVTGLMRFRQYAKRWLPSVVQKSLHVAEDTFHFRLYRPSHLQLWLRDRWGQPVATKKTTEQSRAVYQHALVDWLKRAQDAVPGGGVAGYYALADGWSAAYPETTGYIIVTCLEAATRWHDPELADRAQRMVEWELAVQMPEGAWQSGFVTTPRVPAVFNTGQVIQGLLAAFEAFGESRYLEAAARGGQWLVHNQDEDGAWRRHTYNNFPNSYATRVAWPLVTLAQMTGDTAFHRTALRYLAWASRCQTENGWIEQCTLEVGEPALTHTLAYTIEGFIESGVLLGNERWIAIGKKTADALLHRYEIRRHLAGTYDKEWRGDHSFACVTGCAQMSRVWGRLFELTGDARYLNAALKMNDFVTRLIDLHSRCPGIRGGVKGSQPIWGPYMTGRLPSWAVKFTLDALFQEDDMLASLKGDAVEHYDSVRIPQ